MSTRKGKLKTHWKATGEPRPSFGQLERQPLDSGTVKWGDMQGDLKVESAQEKDGSDGQPKQAHLTRFTQDADLFLW